MAFAPSYSWANKLCPSFVKNCMIQRVPFLRQLSIVDFALSGLNFNPTKQNKSTRCRVGISYATWTSHIYRSRTFWAGVDLVLTPIWRKHKMHGGLFSRHVNTPASRIVVHLEVAACDFEPVVKRTFRCKEKVTSREHHEIYSQPTSEVLLALWIMQSCDQQYMHEGPFTYRT